MAQPVVMLGGTFDPVHNGHLIIARAVAETLGFEHVTLVPTASPPHKQPASASAQQRLAMIRLAIEGDALFEVSSVELDRPGPSYTLDTLVHLRQQYGTDVPLYWIIGADMLEMLPKWHRSAELVELAQLVVAYRPPWTADLERTFERLATELPPHRVQEIRRHLVITPQIEISSNDLRRRVREGRSIRYMVPPPVEQYIAQQGLYKG